MVQALLDKLTAPTTSLAQKYRILFSLRGIAGEDAHAAMLEGACRPQSARRRLASPAPWQQACNARSLLCHLAAAAQPQPPVAPTGGAPPAQPPLGAPLLAASPIQPPAHPAGLRDPSALFRHEVAYCLGQRQDPAAVATLKRILKDEAEHPM